MEYQTPELNETEFYVTPMLLDVEEVAGLASGCFTAGISFEMEL